MFYCGSACGSAPACGSAVRFLIHSLPGTCPSARWRSPRDRARAIFGRACRRWPLAGIGFVAPSYIFEVAKIEKELNQHRDRP